jgi:hypothetical protein
MDLDKILESKVACIVLPGDKFNEEIIKILKKIKNKKICYVTLNKGADVLLESLNKNKINQKNFFFIDCVSKTIIQPKERENCQFISSPNALIEISLTINKCIDSGFPLVIVDSLSTFMIYHDSETIIHFFHSLSNKIRNEEGKILILTISNKDKDSEVFKKMEIIVDKIIEVK